MKTEEAPIPNARRSVIEVIVIEMPLFLSIHLTLSLTVTVEAPSVRDGASAIPDININMSSMPIPKMIKKKIQCIFNAFDEYKFWGITILTDY